jgi:SlyX protein
MNAHFSLTEAADRITQLEIKLSFAEDLLDSLNTLAAQQQNTIDRLITEVVALKRAKADADNPGFRSLRDDLPPHY